MNIARNLVTAALMTIVTTLLLGLAYPSCPPPYLTEHLLMEASQERIGQ